MSVSNYSRVKTIPKISTKKSAPTTTNFAKGIFTYKPNDTMDYDEINLAQNARFDRIGEYKTRRGLEKMCEPIGKYTFEDTYSADYDMIPVEDAEINISTTNPIYSINLTVAASNSTDYGVLELSLYTQTGELVARTCAQNLTTLPTDTEFIFNNAPTGNLIATLKTQGIGKQAFTIACPAGTTAPMYQLNSADTGKITNLFETNIEGEISLLFTFKSDGNDSVSLYRMDSEGAITQIRRLPDGVDKVRFSQNVDQIRYADGVEGPHLIDPANDWADTAISTTDLKTDVDLNIKVSNILEGTQDNMIYFDADTTTQAVWTYPYGFEFAPEAEFTTNAVLNAYSPGSTTTTTINKSSLTPVSTAYPVTSLAIGDLIMDDNGNYGTVSTISGNNITVQSVSHIAEPVNSYDKFDRDFRQNFPAILTGDPLTAMFNLGGVVYFLTRRNKYYMYAQTADVWTQQASSAQHGTFSQESCVCDLNYAYYATDDGVYIFDGSSETSITQHSIQSTYDAIQNKESITLELFGNRLYVFYSSNGDGINDACLVYNVNLRLWESFDTGLPVSATIGRQTASNRFICGSSRFGQLYSFENQTNEFADLGAPIDFDLETSYLHFGTPSQLHRIVKWRPEFAKVDGEYTIKCGYALDFTNDVKYAFSINLHNNTPINEHYVWDNPSDYGNIVTPTKLTTIPQVNGQFYRCQIRYQLHSAFTPINFKSMTLSVETQRLR